jgi:hypothetical protein
MFLDRASDFSPFDRVQTYSEDYPNFYSVNTLDCLPRVKAVIP